MDMRVSKIALFLLVGLIGISAIQAGILSDPRKDYDQIDNYLTTAVSTDDVEQNMEKAAEWLAELENKCGLKLCGNSLVKALKKLLQLKTIFGEDKCNLESYEILSKNDLAARYPTTDYSKSFSTRRLDLIVRYYSRKHFETCKNVWPRKLADKLKEVSPESMSYIMKFVQDPTFPWDYSFRSPEYIDLLRSYTDDDIERIEKAAGKKYYYQRHLVTLNDYKKYMVNPCKEVQQKVINELHKPIKFDIDDQSRGKEFWGDGYKEFRQNVRIMKGCKYVVRNEKYIWDKIYEKMENERDGEKATRREKKIRAIGWKRT